MRGRGSWENRRLRDAEACVCGVTYGRFRSPQVPSFAEARQLARLVADDHIARGDHTKQARRSAVLGMMHGAKRSAWRDHVSECGYYAEQEEAEMRETVASLAVKVEELEARLARFDAHKGEGCEGCNEAINTLRGALQHVPTVAEEVRQDNDAMRAQLGGQEQAVRELRAELAELKAAHSTLWGIVGKLKAKEDEREAAAAGMAKMGEALLSAIVAVEGGTLTEGQAIARVLDAMPADLRSVVEAGLKVGGLDPHATGGDCYKRQPGAWAKLPAAAPDTMHHEVTVTPPGGFGRGRRVR